MLRVYLDNGSVLLWKIQELEMISFESKQGWNCPVLESETATLECQTRAGHVQK